MPRPEGLIRVHTDSLFLVWTRELGLNRVGWPRLGRVHGSLGMIDESFESHDGDLTNHWCHCYRNKNGSVWTDCGYWLTCSVDESPSHFSHSRGGLVQWWTVHSVASIGSRPIRLGCTKRRAASLFRRLTGTHDVPDEVQAVGSAQKWKQQLIENCIVLKPTGGIEIHRFFLRCWFQRSVGL